MLLSLCATSEIKTVHYNCMNWIRHCIELLFEKQKTKNKTHLCVFVRFCIFTSDSVSKDDWSNGSFQVLLLFQVPVCRRGWLLRDQKQRDPAVSGAHHYCTTGMWVPQRAHEMMQREHFRMRNVPGMRFPTWLEGKWTFRSKWWGNLIAMQRSCYILNASAAVRLSFLMKPCSQGEKKDSFPLSVCAVNSLLGRQQQSVTSNQLLPLCYWVRLYLMQTAAPLQHSVCSPLLLSN